MPRVEHLELLESDPLRVHGYLYDLVLNGVELGSGSIRCHRPDWQSRIFKTIGLAEEEAQQKFGFLLEAFRYGAPPHGGIALGMDRIAALMAGDESIREVIAFPKTASGQCLLSGAPTRVPEQALTEVHLSIRE
jgi:aspartyl-tRNA synthetase